MADAYGVLVRVLEALLLSGTPVKIYCPPRLDPDADRIALPLMLAPPPETVKAIEEYVRRVYENVSVELRLEEDPILYVYIS